MLREAATPTYHGQLLKSILPSWSRDSLPAFGLGGCRRSPGRSASVLKSESSNRRFEGHLPKQCVHFATVLELFLDPVIEHRANGATALKEWDAHPTVEVGLGKTPPHLPHFGVDLPLRAPSLDFGQPLTKRELRNFGFPEIVLPEPPPVGVENVQEYVDEGRIRGGPVLVPFLRRQFLNRSEVRPPNPGIVIVKFSEHTHFVAQRSKTMRAG